MSINKVSIVGIKGFKGSGKDTVASMISYILHDGIMKANYDTWLLYHKNDFIENDEIIIHFADKLKDDIAAFCNIDRKLLDRQDIKEDIRGKNVLIVEDILDTGKTLYNVKEMLEKRHAKSVKIVTLLDKEEGRVFDMKADYSGFKISNAFVVGYGLDFNERYRQLPYIGILKEDCYKK